MLQQQGWDTASFVAAYVLSRRFGLAAGFATYDDRIPLPAYAGVRLEAERPGNEVVDAALAWLSTHQKRRFFPWVHLYEPHAPYVPPIPFRQRDAHDPYAGEVAAADAQVERLMTWLKTAGLEEKTVVAVLGDHGEALGEHGEATHGLLLYEPTLHVPCIVAVQGLLPTGKVLAEPVSVVDLAPTLLALIGGQRPRGFAPDGRDLSRHLTHQREPEPAFLFAETLYPQTFGWAGVLAVRRGAWKYEAAPRPELFRLEEDPQEERYLAKDRPEQLATLRQALERPMAQQAKAESLPLTR